jgi:2-hydroxy-3-keto-5-methylthiopentenyl-1-phosphate phosphatase
MRSSAVLVIIDFDGTITERDLTDLVWDQYVPPEDHRRMIDDVTAGRISMLELMERGYSFVRKPPAEIVEELRPRVRVRPGLPELARRMSCEVLSCGLDFYIRAFLPCDVPFQSFVATYDGAYHVAFPQGVSLAPGEEFKANRVRALRETHPGKPIVYVGDGRADLEPARLCDRIFAVRGSRLEALCRRGGVAHTVFEVFSEVAP